MFYRVSGISLAPGESEALLPKKASKLLSVAENQIKSLKIYRLSLDARKGKVQFLYTVDVVLDGKSKAKRSDRIKMMEREYAYSVPKMKRMKSSPVVVGFGPAGMFAALVLARAGLCPVVIERGKRVEERVSDVAKFFFEGRLNTESNVQFGEGGAGTFSDGKLNTLLKDKNERGRFVLEEFVKAGAPSEILYRSKPHIGTDRLRLVVKGIREEIIRLGGSFFFETRFICPVVEEGRLTAIEVEEKGAKRTIPCSYLFLGIGHSARDTFSELRKVGIRMEKKVFSIGVRIEHLQEKINFSQYGKMFDSPYLPSAEYKLAVPTVTGKTLYTFCMCPGGVVVPAASEENGVVVNGMSNFDRGGKNANSALLLNVLPEELSEDLFSGFAFQKELERKAFVEGGGAFAAPCQLVGDFLLDRETEGFGNVLPSYERGVRKTKLDRFMPEEYCLALRDGIRKMGNMISGFDCEDALLTGVESRATCPVRILRGENYQSSVFGIYPIGEGAGYAGGIMSSAMDGMRAVEAFIETEVSK